ncbi:hypothetical protein [Oricola sp.]|uniref:hypothetical protein n=1 Tax=Oricola sp. TaxID=1979950 RepID=UPI003512254B
MTVFDSDDNPLLFLLLLALAAWGAWRFLSQRESPEERARRLAEEAKQKRELEEEREKFTGQSVPPDILRAMRDFRSGHFVGEDRSPLAYVGYRVGKTNGLAAWDRRRRLQVCFGIEIPNDLPSKYQGWGRPATWQRFNSIRQHLSMLADMRRHRRNYEHAVADWEEDESWLISEFGELARRFAKHGYAR